MTTNERGTLSGLIADLEELHWYDDDYGHCAYCLDHCVEQSWPCPTMQAVQNHKRSQWDVYLFGPMYGEKLWSARKLRMVGIQTCPVFNTQAEAEAWVDAQVKGP